MKIEVAIKDRVVIVGDFNCKEVIWEEFKVGNVGEWDETVDPVGEAPNKRSVGRYPVKTGCDIYKRSTARTMDRT
ncbi:hypothetical protein E2C01_045680 [Portunus trituberculatus]|uniref:Endonuclease/exonuclease/phosphatase domain-containing protein n=1 Tax=Portunus trituberculatus TaxID=210409 RepID=A0A5B7G213_PORTR|nr:hypothetical protein [Portunus trituberculatus]